MEDRIFVQFADGSYINSVCEDFRTLFLDMVAKLGPPVLVEFRAKNIS